MEFARRLKISFKAMIQWRRKGFGGLILVIRKGFGGLILVIHQSIPLFMSLNNCILSWNCLRADNSTFARSLREIMRFYKPVIIILLEPKINSLEADEACSRIGKKDSVR